MDQCVPEGAIATKKELLFSDDFGRAVLGKAWGIVVPIFSIEKGARLCRLPPNC